MIANGGRDVLNSSIGTSRCLWKPTAVATTAAFSTKLQIGDATTSSWPKASVSSGLRGTTSRRQPAWVAETVRRAREVVLHHLSAS